MMGEANGRYILLINDAMKRFVVELGVQEKTRLREKFEFLQNGLWDLGVHVKKLKGISDKTVFEARLSRGDRIIFTLGRHGSRTAIYVWGIVHHDDISAMARRVVPQNAPFLGFQPHSEERLPDISIDDLSGDYYTQEDIEEVSPEDYGPQKWLVLEDEEWRRILQSSDSEKLQIHLFLSSEQERILASDPPLLLSGTAGSGKTTVSVYYLLHRRFAKGKRLFLTCSPYLKRFSEDIYRGLVAATEQVDDCLAPEFSVFRDLLMRIAGVGDVTFDPHREVRYQEFESIFRNHSLSKKYDTELVWEEIRSIVKGAKPQISGRRYARLATAYTKGTISSRGISELRECLLGFKSFEFVGRIENLLDKQWKLGTYDDFVKEIGSTESFTRTEAGPILAEISRIVDRRANRLSGPLLSFQEYLSLGKKRAPNFMYDRREIYGIAEYYQDRLEQQGLWDEIDLCRAVLDYLSSSEDDFRYDLVVCDEVQDFADIQLSLIYRLADTPRGIIFTGDPKQIINPSGFRWEEVKDKFYERGVQVPEVYNLQVNFRCVGSIVKLSNALVDLKQRLVGLSSGEQREAWKFNGKPPMLIHGVAEAAMLRRIGAPGAAQIILVRDEDDQIRLKRTLNTELVFTIHQAKGLEFDCVCLWKFSEDPESAEIWRRIRVSDQFDERHGPHIRHEISLLYVAITRARNVLVIYDGERPSDVWSVKELENLVFRTSEEDAVAGVWDVLSTPEQWTKQGDYFYEREYYSAAAECYRNAGDAQRAELAEALQYEARRDYRGAARLFAKHGMEEKAARNFELAGEFRRAAILWKRLEQTEHARTCRAQYFESVGRYERAAVLWERVGDDRRALADWLKAENHEKIADHHAREGHYENAAREYERAGKHETAALYLKKAGKHGAAADVFFGTGDFKRAAPLYRKSGNTDRLLECYLELGRDHRAGLIYEKRKELGRARDCFDRFAARSEDNRRILLAEAERFDSGRNEIRAAVRLSALKDHERSAEIFLRRGFIDEAVWDWRQVGNHRMLSVCYQRQKKHQEAARELEDWALEVGDMSEEIRGTVRDELREHLHADSGQKDRLSHQLHREAERLQAAGSYDRALVRFQALDDADRAYELYLRLRLDSEALRYFFDTGRLDYLGGYLEAQEDLRVSVELLDYLSRSLAESQDLEGEQGSRQFELVAEVFRRALAVDPDETARSLVGGLLLSVRKNLPMERPLPESFIDLLLESRDYNTILHIAQVESYLKTYSIYRVDALLASVRHAAAETDDRNMLACCLSITDKARYEMVLGDLPLTDWNVELFAESENHYHRAVNYYLENAQVEGAVEVCTTHRDYRRTGLIYEQIGDPARAGSCYRDAGLHQDALRCFGEADDETNVARVLELTGEYARAMEIWRKLGRTDEIARLRKKPTD